MTKKTAIMCLGVVCERSVRIKVTFWWQSDYVFTVFLGDLLHK